MIEELNIKNHVFKGKEDLNIESFKKEISQHENIISLINRELIEDEIKLKNEEKKN